MRREAWLYMCEDSLGQPIWGHDERWRSISGKRLPPKNVEPEEKEEKPA
jgi:hypothetical protein